MLWSPNLQLYYPFENQANDYSGNARHGTVNGSGVYATKPNGGRCLYFDGTGDYVATPSFGMSGTIVVIAGWQRSTLHVTERQSLFSCPFDDVSIGMLSVRRHLNTNNLGLTYTYSSGATTVSDTDFFAGLDGQWLHFVIVADFSGKVCYFYRNAMLRSNPAMSSSAVFPSTAQPYYLGSYDGSSYFLTNGYLQSVQIWTLATMPAAAHMLANVNRMMLGMNPIW